MTTDPRYKVAKRAWKRNGKPLPDALGYEDFTVYMDETHTYPFFEDEDAHGVYGHGHVGPAAFASAVNQYDEHMNDGPKTVDETYYPSDVRHSYVQGYRTPDGEVTIRHFTDTPFDGATPVTWVAR